MHQSRDAHGESRRNNTMPAEWSAHSLRSWLDSLSALQSVIVLANRGPSRQPRSGRGPFARGSGGLVTALEPLIHACNGVWVAHGTGSTKRIVLDGCAGLNVVPAISRFRLRAVGLSTREEQGYYYGFSNEGLWPLCHRTPVRPVFRFDDYRSYRTVNSRFVDAVCEEADTDSPVVFVQDYHFALAPLMIRTQVPQARIVAFWHIPFPSPREWAACPWGRPLLEGLLGSSIVGFQTRDDCLHFVHACEYLLHARIAPGENAVVYEGRRTRVHAYPVSVEWPSQWALQSPPVERCSAAVRSRFGLPEHTRLIVGIDRMDYTKGIKEKCLALERLLALQSELRERIVLLQIAEPSRACLPAYRECRSQIIATVDRINLRFGTNGYRPIILLEEHREPADVFELLRAADVCYVGSLHDGMNLVAKEFVSARDDERGVLILSKFAGAARELTTALQVNPFYVDSCATAIADALNMPAEEQATRMRAMRDVVEQFNAYRWTADILTDAAWLRDDAIPVLDSLTSDTSEERPSLERPSIA
jgi:trehalose 6-phosphate synthase